jgi:hypothetical protein
MTARYVLCPGPVRSARDGQLHHVSAGELRALYRVDPRDCLVMPVAPRVGRCGLREWVLEAIDAGDLVPLGPRYDGDYTLPPPPQPKP